MNDYWRNILKGALKGGLVTGGLGFGIPATYHAAKGNLGSGSLGTSARFGLLSSIPGALIGAILATPSSDQKLKHPDFYLGSLEDEDDLLYKDLMKLYNADSTKRLSENAFRQLYHE